MTVPRPIAIVHNARSERNKAGLEPLRAMSTDAKDVVELMLDGLSTPETVAALLAHIEPRLLAVNGGDGTVQRLLTALLEGGAGMDLPPLAILPRGMANMTASDCGLTSRAPAALGRLLALARGDGLAPHLVERRVLRVEGAVDTPPQRGMFLGAAGIWDAIHLCTATVHTKGLKGEAAHLATLLRILVGWTVGRKPAGMLEGEEVAADLDGEKRHGRELLLLATTLDRLVVRSRPFWNEDRGPVRYTSIAYPAERVLRRAWTVLYGRDRSHLDPAAFFSRGASRIELRMDCGFTIDGELFRASSATPLVISAPDVLRFVRF